MHDRGAAALGTLLQPCWPKGKVQELPVCLEDVFFRTPLSGTALALLLNLLGVSPLQGGLAASFGQKPRRVLRQDDVPAAIGEGLQDRQQGWQQIPYLALGDCQDPLPTS